MRRADLSRKTNETEISVSVNLDGTGDIIMGAGREEFQACDSAVIALDGRTGKILWHVPAEDQIFGSAVFKDIDAGDKLGDPKSQTPASLEKAMQYYQKAAAKAGTRSAGKKKAPARSKKASARQRG